MTITSVAGTSNAYANLTARFTGEAVPLLDALSRAARRLTRCDADRTRQQALARETNNARAADDLAGAQYRAGLVPFSTVLTTEAALLSAEDSAAQNANTTAQDVIALYKALGGGWNDSDSVAAK